MKIIVDKVFHYDRRPERAIFHKLKPDPAGKPVTVIKEVGEAAIAAGAAREFNGRKDSTDGASGN